MKNKYIINDKQTIIKELSDLRGHLDIAIDQLKNGQGCVLTKNWLMANILMLLGTEEIYKVYNENGEIKYYCSIFPMEVNNVQTEKR